MPLLGKASSTRPQPSVRASPLAEYTFHYLRDSPVNRAWCTPHTFAPDLVLFAAFRAAAGSCARGRIQHWTRLLNNLR